LVRIFHRVSEGAKGRTSVRRAVGERRRLWLWGMLPPRASHLARRCSRQNRKLFLNEPLVPHFINTATFATRDFWPRRGASDAHTLQGSVRSEQRRRGQKEPSPGGLRRFSVLASLLLGHSPTSGDAPLSRLARTENRRNKRGRIYETGYLVDSAGQA